MPGEPFEFFDVVREVARALPDVEESLLFGAWQFVTREPRIKKAGIQKRASRRTLR